MATMDTLLDASDSHSHQSSDIGKTSEIVYLSSRTRATRFIWGLLTLCCLAIAGLPYFTSVEGLPVLEPEALNPLLMTFTAFAVIMGLASLFIRFYLITPQRLMRLAGQRCADSDEVHCTLHKFTQMWMIFSVMLWGLNESIASLGLAEALAARDPSRVLPFAFAALILNLAARPELRDLSVAAGVYTPAAATTWASSF